MDPSWEFQAPQFVDFNNLEADEDTTVDEFFDVDMESGVPLSFGSEDIPNTTPMDQPSSEPQNLDKASESSQAAEESIAEEEKPKKPRNMVMSWGPGATNKITATSKAPPPTSKVPPLTSKVPPLTSKVPPLTSNVSLPTSKAPTGVSGGAKNIPTGDEPHTGRWVRPRTETPTRKILRMAVAQSLEAARSSPRRTGAVPKRLGTNTSEPRSVQSRAQSSVIAKSINKTSAMRRRTLSNSPGAANRAASRGRPALPKTPEILKRARNRLGRSQENEEVGSKKSQLTAHRKLNEKMSRGPMKPPTRVKDNAMKEHTSTLRSYAKGLNVPESSTGMTVPKPFSTMETARKRRHSADPKRPSKFISMAEKVNKFQKETPQRFRSRPNGPNTPPFRSRRGRSASPSQRAPDITIPKTPHLTAKHRARPTYVLSREEQEKKDLEEAKKKQFKAHAVGEGVPTFNHVQVETRPSTVPEPFHLTEQHHAPVISTEATPAPFKAQPLPSKIFHAVTGLPEKKLISTVVPASPAFATKERLANRKQAAVEAEPSQEPIIRAKPAPHRNITVILPTIAKKSTVPQPFSFSGRDQTLMQKKEEKVKKVLEEEAKAREFHAQPILAPPPLPPRKPVIELTQPKPFALKMNERVESRVAQWQEDVQKELEEQRKAANFKAQEAKVLTKAPFEPKIPEKPLRELDNISRPFAHSEKRAEERARFELEQKQKEAELEGAKRLLEERKKREEEEEIARIRREAVPKAQPIRHYKPVEVHPSEKPLTMPMSPSFRLKEKSRE